MRRRITRRNTSVCQSFSAIGFLSFSALGTPSSLIEDSLPKAAAWGVSVQEVQLPLSKVLFLGF